MPADALKKNLCPCLVAATLALGACGQTGALYLPDDEPVETVEAGEAEEEEDAQ